MYVGVTEIVTSSTTDPATFPNRVELLPIVLTGVCSFLVGILCGAVAGIGIMLACMKKKGEAEDRDSGYEEMAASPPTIISVRQQEKRKPQEDVQHYKSTKLSVKDNVAYISNVELQDQQYETIAMDK